MYAPRRHRTRHHPTMTIDHDGESFSLWLPEPECAPQIIEFGDAVALACFCLDLPMGREVLVLLDDSCRVTAMLLDPPPALGVGIGWYDGPGLELPFSQTLDIVLVPSIDDRPPSDEQVSGYRSLRRLHMLQGLLLLDMILMDGDRMQSLAIATDPDCEWFRPDRLAAADAIDAGADDAAEVYDRPA